MNKIILFIFIIIFSCSEEIYVGPSEDSELIDKYIQPEIAYRTNMTVIKQYDDGPRYLSLLHIYYDNEDYILIIKVLGKNYQSNISNVYVTEEEYNKLSIGELFYLSNIKLNFEDFNNKKVRMDDYK